MKLFIGSDHAGFELKEFLKANIPSNFSIQDVGVHDTTSKDYPDYASVVATHVASEKAIGILICGSGIGMSIVANKYKGVRAALCHDEYTAKVAREHNFANVLCVGGRIVDNQLAKKIVSTFLSTPQSDEQRHTTRVDKISQIEKDNFK